MPSITLTLTDTPAGGVSVATSFRPAISHPCSPAQSYALEILARTRQDLGLPELPYGPQPQTGFPHLYLAGPMSGLPDCNYPAFHMAAAKLRELGYRVTNPAENGLPRSAPWAQHMRADIKGLLDCDGLAVLPGHEHSAGARIEIELATKLGMTVGSIVLWVDLVKSGFHFKRPATPLEQAVA
ncbi:hypothetical protein C6P61_09605 [Malikia spinosa]|uniref:DUF4406 domain-containing protein n=1 Tax=Malikia spinosa TaxID=86180 RepID=A0A2S9KE79_9BURK|nr:DUF4406 domain-containing protein [Malikia spinosa]PRD68747.1 hypothetical protein C6P61_09605 [Malikia spinosa]